MKQVKKAVVLAAGLGVRFLPATKALPKEMMPIVDKPALQYIIEEAVASGIEEIMVVTNSNKNSIENHFDRDFELESRLQNAGKIDDFNLVRNIADLANIYYVRQKQPRGLGNAVLCAASFVKNEPFALMLGDDIIVSENGPALKSLIDFYENVYQAPVIAVQQVRNDELEHFGVVGIASKFQDTKYMRLEGVVEKPSIDKAPSNLGIIGRYILTPEIFDILQTQEKNDDSNYNNHLSEALVSLMNVRSVYGYNIQGKLYDIEDNLTYLKAVVDFACERDDLKDQVRAYICEVASRL